MTIGIVFMAGSVWATMGLRGTRRTYPSFSKGTLEMWRTQVPPASSSP